MREINEIILHASATPEGRNHTVKDIRQWHLQRGFSDIGYHFLIDINGKIFKGRPIDQIGAHCTGHNKNSIGICYVGGVEKDCKTPKDTRTEEQRYALLQLVCYLCDKYKIADANIHGHNFYAAKSCPCFSVEQFIKDLQNFRQHTPWQEKPIEIL